VEVGTRWKKNPIINNYKMELKDVKSKGEIVVTSNLDPMDFIVLNNCKN